MALLHGTKILGETIDIREVLKKDGKYTGAIVSGQIFDVNTRKTRNDSYLTKAGIYDGETSMYFQFFSDDDLKLKDGMFLKVKGSTDKSKYTGGEYVLMAESISSYEVEVKARIDEAPVKRVELQLHTEMSQLEGLENIKTILKVLKNMGHEEVAITDTSLQAFPDAYNAAKDVGIKLIFGASINIIDDSVKVAYETTEQNIHEATYTVFDVETTGFSNRTDHVIEIGATQFKNGVPVSSFQRYVKSPKPIPAHITKLTGITQETVDNEGIDLTQAMKEFDDFWSGTILVAHNYQFDKGMIIASYKRSGMTIPVMPAMDTLQISRCLNPTLKSHTLDKLSRHYGVKLPNHHRADQDAEATGHLFMHMLVQLKELGIEKFSEVNNIMPEDFFKVLFPNRINVLVENEVGLKNLYKITSHAHVTDLTSRGPAIAKSHLEQFREGILVGSGSHLGELFELALNKLPEDVVKAASFYDYLEIQPSEVASHLVRGTRAESMEAIESAWKLIYLTGKKLNKPVVATGHVHYLEEADSLYYNILLYNEKAGMKHEKRRGRLDDPMGLCHFRTTEEMLKSFPYLNEEETYKVVVENTREIAAKCKMMSPIPLDEKGNPKLFTPKIEGANEELRDMSYEKARKIYGNTLPDLVEKRLEKELASIIGNGFAVIYLISQKLVKQSNDRGYLVGSRGSIGSSFVATMSGITEVNPLVPHYICPSETCKHVEFIEDGSYGSGFDLPDKNCVSCGTKYKKDGQDIPFETFLGFEGDKVPDIDLNFSGEDQPRAHKDVETEFGSEYVFRAGTVGTIADKTAFGFVKGFTEDHIEAMNIKINQLKTDAKKEEDQEKLDLLVKEIEKLELEKDKLKWSNAEVGRVAKKVTGTKRTTGQHPGGILVVPDYMDVHDFTGFQHPANKASTGIRTSHFDFHAIHDNILKLDILGHDNPTILRLLQDSTTIDPKNVPVDDPKVIKLWSGDLKESLGIDVSQIKAGTGTLGIPEMGTDFVQAMVLETKPQSFSDLLRVSGLSHGTDVWIGNAQQLIANGTATLRDVIDTRDNIMVELMHKGLKPKDAFTIMESVRKGKGLRPEWEDLMRQFNVPEWYIDSCKKIKYMFPKAHAAAYVLDAVRIGWYKVYYPVHYYAAVFSARFHDQDIKELMQPSNVIKTRIEELENEISSRKSQGKTVANESKLRDALNLALEAKERGIVFGKVRLYESSDNRFLIDGNELIPPFSGIKGVGEKVAIRLYEEAQIAPFRGLEDLTARTKANKTNVGVLRELGCLDNVEAKQHTFF